MDFKMHEYTHAVVGKFTSHFHHKAGGFNVDGARHQYECYSRLLRELNVEVIEMDCTGAPEVGLHLEEFAVICHGIALLPRPSQRFEDRNVKVLKNILKSSLGQTIIEQKDQDVNICGSDVLFTGHEFFVGISETTNEAGASAIAEAFPEFPCTPIKVSSGSGHLKKYITVAGSDILCVGESKEAKEILKRMEREANFSYQTLTVPEGVAANCLYVNGTLIHRAIEEIPESFKVFCEKIDFARRSICFSELAKLNAGLSSCCLLVRKP